MSYDNDEEEVITEETEEGTIETIATLEYLCTACFDVLSATDLGENKDNCPSCGETDCIAER